MTSRSDDLPAVSQAAAMRRGTCRRCASLLCGGLLVLLAGWAGAKTFAQPNSFFAPSEARTLSQSQRWQLDFELANEYMMGGINSKRFMHIPERATWFEEQARRDEIADLLVQLFDFRTGSPTYHEPAFRRLFEMGKAGNVSAACMAAYAYRPFVQESTRGWRYSYQDAARLALEYRNTGHPVCRNVEGALFEWGHAGYPRDPTRARPFIVDDARQGFYWAQTHLAAIHLPGTALQAPGELARELCWRKVAERQSQHAGFPSRCDALRSGLNVDENGRLQPVSDALHSVADEWCTTDGTMRSVTSEDCARMEHSVMRSAREGRHREKRETE